MKITKDTKVFDILQEYGDIADVMEAFGVKRVGKYSVRRLITRILTVERAAKVHKVDLAEFLTILNKAIDAKETEE
jgi:Ca2+-binding EF-hand superfamily protein